MEVFEYLGLKSEGRCGHLSTSDPVCVWHWCICTGTEVVLHVMSLRQAGGNG